MKIIIVDTMVWRFSENLRYDTLRDIEATNMAPFYQHCLTCISEHMTSEMREWNYLSIQNVNGVIVEVKEWIRNFVP